MKPLHAGGEAASFRSSTEESSCANLPEDRHHVESVIRSAASQMSKMSPAYMYGSLWRNVELPGSILASNMAPIRILKINSNLIGDI